jgi:DNA-binding transcriptional regulator YiaG
MTTDADREKSRRWYRVHRATHNKNRAKAYKADKDLQTKARERAARLRASKKHRTVFQVVRLESGVGYTFDHVAHLVGVTEQTIRNWESKGYALPPTVSTRPRIYTGAQVNLLKSLKLAIDLASAGTRKIDENNPRMVAAVNNIIEEWSDGNIN